MRAYVSVTNTEEAKPSRWRSWEEVLRKTSTRGNMKKKLTCMQIICQIFGLAFLCVCLYFGLGECFLPDEQAEYEPCEMFQADWEWVKEDGTREPITIPGQCDARRNEIVTIETTLPENIEHGMYLCIRSSKQDMRIFVDGKLRQEYSTEDTRLFGRNSAVVYIFFKLEGEDAGKTLALETRTDSSYSGIFYPIYYGERMEIWNNFFAQYGVELIVAFLTLFLGVISVVGSLALQMVYHQDIHLQYLGWGVSLAAIWLIMNSVFRQMIFSNISVVNDMTFFTIMLLPLPFMIYMNSIQNQRYQKAYNIAGILVLVNFCVCTFLHVMNWKDFADTIVVIALFCVGSVGLMGVTILIDAWKKHIKEYRLEAIGVIGASLAAVLQIVLYFVRVIQFSGTILAVGLIFLLVTAVVKTIHSIVAMEQDKRKAILSSEAKARFLANMSHEIRTPINAVLGMDAMILRECKDMQIKEYALDIQNAGQNLLALVNDILDLSKVESGKMELIPVEYDVSSMVHDITNMITVKAQDKDLELRVQVDPNLPSRLFGDEVRIRQILINILNNAVKYTHEGSVELKIEGQVEGEQVLLVCSVSDTGIGIKEEDLPKLFAEFERIEEQKNQKIEGTGLGMSITAKLLNLMGSKLQVESVYGEGSRFFFELEQAIIDHQPIGNLEERIRQQSIDYAYQAAFTAPEARLLVVDDNAVNLKVFVNLLKETQVKIDAVSSGQECLDLVMCKHYDMIFLDHMMPDMDGIETLHRMKQLSDYPCKNTPVIVLTANAVSGAKEMYLSEGFDGFLSKPIMPDRLENLIRQTLPQELLCFETKSVDEIEHNKDLGDEDQSKQQQTTTDLPNIAGIDWNCARLHLPEQELLLETVRDFYRSIGTEADCLEEYYNAKDLEDYRIKVHAMKSSAALIGATSLSDMAKMLEYAARDKQMDIIDKSTDIFLEEWRRLKEKLSVLVKEETDKQEVEDYSVVLAYLEMLRLAMEDMDIDGSDEAMEQLRQYQYPLKIQAMIDELSAAVTNLDSEQAATIIETLMNHIRESEGNKE